MRRAGVVAAVGLVIAALVLLVSRRPRPARPPSATTVEPPTAGTAAGGKVCARWIAGDVTDADGGPIAGAQIVGEISQTTTSSDGGFRICGTGKPEAIRAIADGYGVIETEVMGGDGRVDFVLQPEAHLAGIVVDEHDRPVVGAHVEAAATSNSLPVPTRREAVTAANGRFAMDGVAPAGFRLTARTVDAVTVDPVEAETKAGAVTEVRIRVRALAVIRGRVVDAGDRPLGQVGLACGDATATSAADGTFTFRVEPEEEATVRSDTHELSGDCVDFTGECHISVDEPTVDVVLHAQPLASISGVVVSEGEPVAGAKIVTHTARPSMRSFRLMSLPVESGADGTFTIGGLGKGRYAMHAELDGQISTEVEVEVADKSVDGVRILLDEASSAAGTIVDTDGRPVAGVEVGRLGAGQARTTTAADGSFELAPLPTGELEVYVVREMTRDTERVTIPTPGTHLTGLRWIVESATASIAGRVFAAGVPIANTTVEASASRGTSEADDCYDPRSAITAADGSFRISDLTAGKYDLCVDAPEGHARALAMSGDEGVVLTLAASGSIRGTLVGFVHVPHIAANGGGYRVHTATVDGDRFTIEDLTPGVYDVKVMSGTWQRLEEKSVAVAPGATADVTFDANEQSQVRGSAAGASRCAAIPAIAAPHDDDLLSWLAFRTWRYPTGNVQPDGTFEIDGAQPGPTAIACDDGAHTMFGVADIQAPAAGVVVTVRPTGFGDRDGYLGIHYAASTDGVHVLSVNGGSPAERGGLVAGDLIVATGNVPCVGLTDAEWMIIAHSLAPGSSVTLTLARGPVTIVVGTAPATP